MSTIELTSLARLAAARRRADAHRARILDAQQAAARAARAANHSWAEIGSVLGVTEGQAKWIAQRGEPTGTSTVPVQRPGRGPGVGVSEAARTLGVTRRTVYLWAEEGRLAFTKNELGRTRILLEVPATV